jgi:transposase
MRKSIDGLSAIVEQELGFSLFAAQLFVFCNRRRDHVS